MRAGGRTEHPALSQFDGREGACSSKGRGGNVPPRRRQHRFHSTYRYGVTCIDEMSDLTTNELHGFAPGTPPHPCAPCHRAPPYEPVSSCTLLSLRYRVKEYVALGELTPVPTAETVIRFRPGAEVARQQGNVPIVAVDAYTPSGSRSPQTSSVEVVNDATRQTRC